ncbi:basic helix-loop-helix protein [Mortierella sp. GBA30]|nr:basic helix-loop-helix protein [Mortierella sp. GBA30]
MESNQEVQDVIKNLTNTISAVGESLSFQVVIEEHARTTTNAASVAEAAAEGTSSAPISVDASHFDEQQQRDHEELRRIAEQHQQEIQQQHQQQQDVETEQAVQPQEHSSVVAPGSQDADHQQVLQHIATAAAEAEAAEAVSTLATVPILESTQASTAKLVPGSEEWHKVRRDNHKEVERRRRETINAGINELAKLIPNSEKNKGSILRQAVRYITSVQVENERLVAEANSDVAANAATRELEKALLDKALVEKSVAEGSYLTLREQHEQLKQEYEALRKKMGELSEEHASKKQRTE